MSERMRRDRRRMEARSIAIAATVEAPGAPAAAGGARVITVWDPFVRLFHWTLVAATGFAAVSGLVLGPRWIDPHVWAGLTAAGLVLARILWGFLGTRHARFSDFLRGPRHTLAHLRELLEGRAPRHIGHNPLGGWMVLALIIAVLALAATGLAVWGGEFHRGPLAAAPHDAGAAAHELHRLLAWGLIALVALHTAGAVFESLRTRENLPLAMVTGRKRLDPAERIGELRAERALQPRPLAFAAGCAAIALAAALGWQRGAAVTPAGAPPAPEAFPEVYATECGDCHIAYNPSLLPAASWRALMASLEDHFGEDASLDPETVAQITDFLVSASAEHADTRPAHLFRAVDPARPFQITATPAWRRIHGKLPEELFKRAPIYGRFNCAACHGDAESGWFYPGNIRIPPEPAGAAAGTRAGAG